MMGFWGVSNILLFTGLGIIAFFALNSAKEDDRTDVKEFFKLSGILISLSVLCVIFIDLTFIIIQAVSWLILYLFSVLKDDIFTLGNGYLLTLLLVNAGGAYMVWELRKEREEEKRFKEETTAPEQQEEESTPVRPEDSSQEAPTAPVETETPAPAVETVAQNSAETDNNETKEELQEESEENPEYKILTELDLSQRVAKTLHEAGIGSAKELTENSIDQLKDIKNLGGKSIEDIEGALKKAGLSLKAV